MRRRTRLRLKLSRDVFRPKLTRVIAALEFAPKAVRLKTIKQKRFDFEPGSRSTGSVSEKMMHGWTQEKIRNCFRTKIELWIEFWGQIKRSKWRQMELIFSPLKPLNLFKSDLSLRTSARHAKLLPIGMPTSHARNIEASKSSLFQPVSVLS
jgi:hypothetical protein